MRTLLERIAAAIRREPPTLKWIEESPAVPDLPLSERDRDLNEGRTPDPLDRRS
jgi:hypothetical protein